MQLWKTHWRAGLGLMTVLIVMMMRVGGGDVQQDNYLVYADHIQTTTLAKLDPADSRLLPGLPLLLATVTTVTKSLSLSGVLLTTGSALVSYVLLYYLTKNRYAAVVLVFPPILLEQFTIVGTESILVAGVIAALYLMRQQLNLKTPKTWWLGTFLLASMIWVRLIAAAALVAVVGYELWHRRWQRATAASISLFFSLTLLMAYNYAVFGPTDPFHQILVYSEVGRAQPAVVQLVSDIFRAWDWGWYRSLISGGFYLLLCSGWLMYLVRHRSFDKKSVTTWIIVAMVLFVFSVGPTPFLEEFARFLMPVFVLLWLKTLLDSVRPTFKRDLVLLLASAAAVVITLL